MTQFRPPAGLFVFAFLFAVLMTAGWAVTPPAVRAANTEAEFDAPAAVARLARVLGDETPHPIDSEAQDAVRAALLTEIRALGFEPAVRERFACRPNPNSPLIDCMMTRNIAFSAGPAAGPSILAVTHYDSVPAAPGAADAGIGLAVWLEIARHAARDQNTFERRVIFLFTDGEEPALMGAHVFAAQDPLMQEAEALINLEARGTRGPALFFETNQPNADAVNAFATARGGMANSVMADVYRMLPNNTDVTEFMRPGLDVVNIAISDGLENYHTPRDSLANLDPRSVQHMGDVALATVRAFASGQDRNVQAQLVYTDVAGQVFLAAPGGAVLGVLAACALAALLAFWRAGAAGRWRALAAPLVALAAGGGLTFVAGWAFGAARPLQDFWFAHPEAARAWCVLIPFAALAAALPFAPRNPALVGAAGAFWFALIGLLLSRAAPGVSILFAVPAAPYALGALAGLAWPRARSLGAALAAALVLAIWAPALALVEITLGFSMAAVFGVGVTLIACHWLGAIVAAQGQTRWRGSALALGAGAVAALAWGALSPSYSSTHPQPLNLHYFSSGDEARILAGPARRALPPGLARALAFEPRRTFPSDRTETWSAPAEIEAVPRPTLSGVSVSAEGGQRVVRMQLFMNGAYRATLRIPRAAEPVRAHVRGVDAHFAATGGGGDFLNLACQGRSCDGAEIAITLPDGGADALAGWLLIGQTPGVYPSSLEAARAVRPPEATPIQFGDGVLTLERLSATPAAQN